MIIRSKAPLRLGLAGGGTDVAPYCDVYGGCVLNVTIDMYAYCTIEPNDSGSIEFISSDMGQSFSAESVAKLEIDDVLILHKGVYNRIVKDFNGGKPLSFKMTTYSDAPPGSGLGSSSTMVVAMLKAYMEWLNLPLGEYDMASLAYDIERVDLKLAGGKQDQYAATFGGFNFIEFYKDNKVIVNPLRFKKWIKNEIESSLVLFFTGKSRESAKIIKEQIKSTESKNKGSLEGMHELKELTRDLKESVLMADFNGIAENMIKSWEAKKKTSSAISNSDIDDLYNFVMANGGKAAKISGAGGGGFMMIICSPEKRYDLIQALKGREGSVMVTSFTEKGTQAWTIYDM